MSLQSHGLVVVLAAALSQGCAVGASADVVKPAAAAQRSFIVLLQAGTTDVPAQARRLTQMAGGQLGTVYQSAVKGFVVQMSDEAASRLRQDPLVLSVEPDAPVRLQAQDAL